jgi:hypothetical protein
MDIFLVITIRCCYSCTSNHTIFRLFVVFKAAKLPLRRFLEPVRVIYNVKMAKNLFVLLIFLLAGSQLSSQQLSPDLQTLLPTLNSADSLKALGYARYQGAYHGRQLETTCKLLDTTGQRRVASYIRFLQHPGEPEPTTVQYLRDTISFGTINEGFILLDSFVVVNTGNQPYVISSSKGSCDCTALSLPKYPVMPSYALSSTAIKKPARRLPASSFTTIQGPTEGIFSTSAGM